MNHSLTIYRQARTDVDIKKTFKGFVIENYRKKLSAEERFRREEQQKAAIRIQRFNIHFHPIFADPSLY